MRPTRLFAFLLVFCSSFAVAGDAIRVTHTTSHGKQLAYELPAPSATANVIVEFHGAPNAVSAVRASANRELHTRFRRDLESFERVAGKSAIASRIRFEYSAAFLGAAVSVPHETLGEIRRLPYVRRVHDDVVMKAFALGPSHDAAQRVNAASLPTRGKGITVAVLDTGIDYRHPALGGAFGPGHKVAGGYDLINNDGDPLDDHGHGTHVAGTVAAESAELLGVAPEATLFAYKVLDANGSGASSIVMAGIERAVDPNSDGDHSDAVDVVNLSLGAPGHPDDPTSIAVDNAVAAGVIVCVAAGNDGKIGSIGSPGTARSAITVGAIDANNNVTGFSSRGPTLGVITFKPDVVAPGADIISTRMGGGTVAFNGTSMATPHVAGACALLKALHPDWTPAQFKSALATSSLTTQGIPWARGVGRVDVAAATIATTFLDLTGISFGLHATSTGSSDHSNVITISNPSANAQTFDVAIGVAPAGVTMSANPQRVTVPAHGTAQVTISAHTDNTQVTYPDDMSVAGGVTFTGPSTFTVPWTMLRAARVVIHSDTPLTDVIAYARNTLRQPVRIGPQSAEVLLAPGGTLDVVGIAYERAVGSPSAEPSVMRILAREDIRIEGEQTVELRRADAVHRLTMDARDDTGASLASLPRVKGEKRYLTSIRYTIDKELDVSSSFVGFEIHSILMSDVSAGYKVLLAELYTDLEHLRAYAVQHPVQTGPLQTKTLANTNADFVRTRIQARDNGAAARLGTCVMAADTRNGFLLATGGDCISTPQGSAPGLDLFITPEASPDAYIAFYAIGTTRLTPPLRALDSSTIVPSLSSIPPVTAMRIPHNSTIMLGSGPVFPLNFFGTIGSYFISNPPSGIHGPFSDGDAAGESGVFTMYDANGAIVRSGVTTMNLPRPAAAPGYRLEATIPNLNAGGRSSRGTLQVQFGNAADDVEAPTLSSLQLIGANDLPTDRLSVGELATLKFSVADYNFRLDLDTKSPGPAPRVSYRTGNDWLPLTVVKTGSERGTPRPLGHLGAGDLFAVDLSPVTAIANVAVDLRFELEDLQGNKVVWTQQPAFVVGEPATTPRRRAARK